MRKATKISAKQTTQAALRAANVKPELPKELFGQEPNANLLAQAYYVYESRSHPGTHKTKTRGEITATTAKVYRQKGTGRARHGSKRAPIYVGGGVVFGPTGEKRVLGLSKKLSRRALVMALSARNREGKVFVIDGKTSDGKTKTAAKLLAKLGVGKQTLILHAGEKDLFRSARNIVGVSLLRASEANAYSVIKNSSLVVTKEGLRMLEEKFGKEKAML